MKKKFVDGPHTRRSAKGGFVDGPHPRRPAKGGFVDDVGRVLAVWLVGLALEHVVVALSRRDELSGAWELWPARTAAAPIFMGVALFLSLGVVVVERALALGDKRPARAMAAIAGIAIGWGVGTGRHFDNHALRALLALAVGASAVGVEYTYLALKKRAPRAVPAVLVVVAVLAWLCDAHVLVRLYPAFHAGLFAIELGASGLAAIETRVVGDWIARAFVVAAAGCAFYAPVAAKRLRGYDNLRRVMVSAAPWMGRAIKVASVLAPHEEGDDFTLAVTGAPQAAKRALDWTIPPTPTQQAGGRDVVLVSIDALRADHVGFYGYARPTTPRIDALAREGTTFRHAYCPTPHTSYSITSMMTGKYMRPLLALGLGADSETLASDLRRYGYRTAAFYPPAVFFIDESKFQSFESRALDFEYRKVEFADPALRERQVREYLATAPNDKPLFLWAHFFEPHEPYVQHPEHHFGDADIDAYDSEVAAADDGVGRVVDAVRAARPNAVVIVTADHGEEFGDHGGRYHGTTVYEEQVRVPLVVVGPGVRANAIVDVPVQTIDIVPTVLSALDIPRPARVRGRDLGVLLARDAEAVDAGMAFAETDDFSLLAKRSLRLVCEKQADACALFDVASDAAEKHDLSSARASDVTTMRAELGAIERSHGRFEGQGAALPDALRRGAAGDASAAEEVAGLLDDVNVGYRREAARVLFDLRSAKPIAQLGRARDHDEDEEVRGTCAEAVARVDKTSDATAVTALLASSNVELRRRAALVLAERGDASGARELVTWLGATGVEFGRQREIVDALAVAKARVATPALTAMLDDVRLRGYVADALGKLGDPAARAPLLAHFAAERYVSMRPREARALVALGAGREMEPALARFAGLPEPMSGAIAIARDAKLLEPTRVGPAGDVTATLRAPGAGPLRVGVLVDRATRVSLEIDGAAVDAKAISGEGSEAWADVPTHGATVSIHAAPGAGVVAGVWLVAKSTELPPPPPAP